MKQMCNKMTTHRCCQRNINILKVYVSSSQSVTKSIRQYKLLS